MSEVRANRHVVGLTAEEAKVLATAVAYWLEQEENVAYASAAERRTFERAQRKVREAASVTRNEWEFAAGEMMIDPDAWDAYGGTARRAAAQRAIDKLRSIFRRSE